VISGFRLEIARNCALLCYYAASSTNFLPTFRDNGPDGLSQNVGKKLRLLTAQHNKQFSNSIPLANQEIHHMIRTQTGIILIMRARRYLPSTNDSYSHLSTTSVSKVYFSITLPFMTNLQRNAFPTWLWPKISLHFSFLVPQTFNTTCTLAFVAATEYVHRYQLDNLCSLSLQLMI